jgi:hypothetical protein
MAVFWDILPFSVIKSYQRFRGAYFIRYQGDDRSVIALMMRE